MRVLKWIGKSFWRFMVIFSFIVNLILVVVLAALLLFLFDIKQNIADPLVGGLHSTAMGLQNATIDWTIPVRDNIPVNLDIRLNTTTIVTLTEPVPLQVSARIDLPGINAFGVAANVNLELPVGLQLPVALDVPVPVRERLDVALDVRAIIPLSQTQLADPIRTLGLLFEPLAIGLHNLPGNWGQVGPFVSKLLAGQLNLLAIDGSGGINDAPYQPWPGYSRSAGLDYDLFNQPVPPANLPLLTGIVPPGGIPALDALLPDRAAIYQQGGPTAVNARAVEGLTQQGIGPQFYDGTMAAYYSQIQASLPEIPLDAQSTSGGDADLGIITEP